VKHIQPWSKACATCRSPANVFNPSWRLHNVRWSTFSLHRSSVPLAEAPLRFLSQARDSTMFSGPHSALGEALCHSLRLCRICGPCWRLHNVRPSTFSLGQSSVLLAEAPPPPPEMSGSSSRIVPTPASFAAIFESSWRLHNVWQKTFSVGQSSVPLAEAPLDSWATLEAPQCSAEHIQPWSKLCATRQSTAEIFDPSWRLHNVWRSTFSLARSSVLLADTPPRFLNQAGDSTMFGQAHSALVKALCHSPKLRHDF
jgi:hypothetical protein